MLTQPTPYPDVNEILALLLTRVEQILGSQFVGLYLYGSLASGDFDPASSDIDFAVVTTGSLPSATASALEAMHMDLYAGGPAWAKKLEGSYLPAALIRRHDPQAPACPSINEGHFYIAPRGSDWIIQRHVLRETGVIVKGPQPRTLIDPVSPEQIRQAVLGVLDEWWFPMLDDPTWLRDNGPHYQAYAVITMCRVLHALAHGTIVSKPVAASWVRARYGARWNALIDTALTAQSADVPAFLDEAVSFIRFTKEQIGTLP